MKECEVCGAYMESSIYCLDCSEEMCKDCKDDHRETYPEHILD